jgi:hypothetical protein
LNNKILLYVTRLRWEGEGVDFMKGVKRYTDMILDIFSDLHISWTTKQRRNSRFDKTINVSRTYDFLYATGMLVSKPTPYKWMI